MTERTGKNIRRILVIDDDEQLRASLAEYLEIKGFVVETCADGVGLREKILEFDPKIILTDMLMPNVEGVEAINIVKKSFPQVHIIAMTGGGPTLPLYYTAHLADAFGVKDILLKPFRMAELLDVLNRDQYQT